MKRVLGLIHLVNQIKICNELMNIQNDLTQNYFLQIKRKVLNGIKVLNILM